MRLRLLAALALIALVPAAAHAQWFNAVYSKDSRDVICVGDSGQVYRSLDGGAKWFRTMVGSFPLRDVVAKGFTIVIAGDSGHIWRSTDNGGTWGLTVIAGKPVLHSIEWPGGDSIFVAGAGGLIHRSLDGGATWAPLASGTTHTLRALRFRDAATGWAVGDNATALRTTNGGASWTPMAVPVAATRRLLGVDLLGSEVWIVGERALALRSTSGGASWTQLNLRIDAGSDVRRVWIQAADSVYLAGGGGFVRLTTDGGATWTFQRHTLQGTLTDLHFAGGGGWMVARTTRLIPRTFDRGATWQIPTGAVQRKTWPFVFSASGSVRGSTLIQNPLDHKTLYTMFGLTLYRSRNDGLTWTSVATVPGGGSKANALIISPKDTNIFLAAVGFPDRIVRSEDGGLTWETKLTMDFGEYGVPLEMHPDKPDTVYFGPDGYVNVGGTNLAPLHRSLDFGKTWAAHGATTFRSPCDIVVVPESDSAVILVGDGITSSGVARIFRSNDGGLTHVATFAPGTGASEVPMMSISRLRNTAPFATAWSTGAFKRSLDEGLTWSNVLAVTQSWGTDIAKDDPNLVVMGSYGNNIGYVSFDGGTSHVGVTALSGSNYSIFARDRGFILAEQSGGIYRLAMHDTVHVQMGQTLALTAPDGGEDWIAGSTHTVTWDALQVALAKIEYRRSAADPWQLVALVDGAAGSYSWELPKDQTTDARVRVSDAWDNVPSDQSTAPFRIRLPQIAADPGTHDFGSVLVGQTASHTVTISNLGDATLEISSIASDNPRFWPGRTTLTIAAGLSDTVGFHYQPDTVGEDTARVTMTWHPEEPAAEVRLYGEGSSPIGVGDGAPLAFALEPNRPNPFTGRTLIRYALPGRERVTLEVFDVTGHRVARLVDAEQGPGVYTVPFGTAGRGARLAAGVYFVRIEAGVHRASRKMLMLK